MRMLGFWPWLGLCSEAIIAGVAGLIIKCNKKTALGGESLIAI